MPLILNLVLRALLVVAGLVFAAVIACFFVFVLALWCLGALWGVVTGKPVARFTVRMGPRWAFEEMMRRAPAAREPSRTPRADAASGVPGRIGDVTDVEPK